MSIKNTFADKVTTCKDGSTAVESTEYATPDITGLKVAPEIELKI